MRQESALLYRQSIEGPIHLITILLPNQMLERRWLGCRQRCHRCVEMLALFSAPTLGV